MLEVDVGPVQAQDLAAAHAGAEDDLEDVGVDVVVGLGRQYGARCPKLNTQPDHGAWAYAVDLPSPAGKRETRRRGGFPDQSTALTALQNFLLAERTGIAVDEALTVAGYLGGLPPVAGGSGRLPIGVTSLVTQGFVIG
ncbi:hypothetical protein ACH4E7_41085 [Kitasatospora sp. NPDC018058]|uniref:hypothetical protein n=1 Tax=Kitasatospora sp. NPDC018058 TaxID=3364025 RepID=UPI0037C15316